MASLYLLCEWVFLQYIIIFPYFFIQNVQLTFSFLQSKFSDKEESFKVRLAKSGFLGLKYSLDLILYNNLKFIIWSFSINNI